METVNKQCKQSGFIYLYFHCEKDDVSIVVAVVVVVVVSGIDPVQPVLRRVRLRSDSAALPRQRAGPDTQSPTRGADTPPRAAACPSSPHKVALHKGRIDSPEKRRLGTFGSAGSINYPERKAYPEGHPLRPAPGNTRHSSLGDHKALETEALAEVPGTAGLLDGMQTSFCMSVLRCLSCRVCLSVCLSGLSFLPVSCLFLCLFCLVSLYGQNL